MRLCVCVWSKRMIYLGEVYEEFTGREGEVCIGVNQEGVVPGVERALLKCVAAGTASC